MAKIENTLKKTLLRIMGRRWDVQSHEDQFSLGIPDLSYGIGGTNGWIELKRVRKWPSRASTKVDLDHFTANQVNWLSLRGKMGGSCFILVQVSTEYFIFSFFWGRMLRAGMTKEEFRVGCIQSWRGSINPDQLALILMTLYD